MKKLSILVLIAVVTVALIYTLVRYIAVDRFSFAVALNFLLMACVLTFTETLKSQFKSPYFNEKVWEKRGTIYKHLGIDFYRKLLVWLGWEKLNKQAKPVKKNNEALTYLLYKTKQDELGHLIIMFIVLGFTVFVAIEYGIVKSLPLLVLNVLLNVYPVLLQRYNRPRIQRALNLSKRKMK